MHPITIAIVTASKAISLYQSSKDVINKIWYPDAPLTKGEKVQLIAQTLFSAFQFADFAFATGKAIAPKRAAALATKLNSSPENVSFRLAQLSGATDVAKELAVLVRRDKINFKDINNLVGVILFRACDINSQAENISTLSAVDKERLKNNDGKLTASITCIAIYKTAPSLPRTARRAQIAFFNWMRRNSPFAKPHEIAALIVPTPREGEDAEEHGREMLRNQVDFIENWQNQTKIPEWLHVDCRLQVFKCTISKAPMRHVRKPNYPYPKDSLLAFTFYDHENIQKWLKDKPGTPPPGWPKDFPFIAENIVADGEMQYRLEEVLNEIATEFRKEHEPQPETEGTPQ